MLQSLFKGLVIGFITGMPLGPIGALCLSNTLKYGRKSGFISGLGSALADSIFAILALLGINTIYRLVVSNTIYLHFIGGIVMIFFGIHMYNTKASNKSEDSKNVSPNSYIKVFFSTMLLALSNPATIFSFIAVFTGANISALHEGIKSKIIIVLGVFLASMGWFVILTLLSSYLNRNPNNKFLINVNKILSMCIILSGAIIFLSTSNLYAMLRPPLIHSKLFEIFLHIKTNFPFYHRIK